MKNKLLPIVLSVFLVSCGGSEDSGELEQPLSSTQNEKINIIELGPVKGASVSIQSLDGFEFAKYQTNDNGEYIVNLDELRKSIDEYDSSLTYVRIIAIGGIDTDPNDDDIFEEGEEKSINGKVVAIVPTEQLLSNVSSRTNLLTTGVAEILGETSSVSEEHINKIASSLGVEDINGDNEINIKDLVNYKMAEHQSRAEVYLREQLLPNIHNGSVDGLYSFVNLAKSERSMLAISIVKQTESSLLIKFPEVEVNNYIQYGFMENNETVSFNQYQYNDEIEIELNTVLYYQECITDSNCYKIQKLFYDGQEYFHDYIEYEPAPNLIDDEAHLNALTDNFLAKKEEIAALEQKIIEQKKYIEQFGG